MGRDMNLRTLLPILVLTTFVLLLVACGGGSQSADTPTPVPETVFNPSLFEVRVEEAVVYGTGGTLDGGQVELLLDLAIPDTGTDGPRPLFVHIHGGDFVQGSRHAYPGGGVQDLSGAPSVTRTLAKRYPMSQTQHPTPDVVVRRLRREALEAVVAAARVADAQHLQRGWQRLGQRRHPSIA